MHSSWRAASASRFGSSGHFGAKVILQCAWQHVTGDAGAAAPASASHPSTSFKCWHSYARLHSCPVCMAWGLTDHTMCGWPPALQVTSPLELNLLAEKDYFKLLVRTWCQHSSSVGFCSAWVFGRALLARRAGSSAAQQIQHMHGCVGQALLAGQQ
jgi:hypothetical protein